MNQGLNILIVDDDRRMTEAGKGTSFHVYLPIYQITSDKESK